MPCARAADASPVSVDVDSMTPTIAGPTTPVTITGTVTNRSDEVLAAPKVRVGVSAQLLDTTSAVEDWTSGKLDVATHEVAGASLDPIAPGTSEQFTVTIAKKTLNYTYGLASLPMTVQVTGAGGTTPTVRTTLEWSKKSPTSPMRSTFVVPLTLPADPALYGPSGPERVAAWNRAIGPGSRIDQLISDLGSLPVTWVVDPSIVHPPVAADDNLPKAPATGSTSSPSSTPSQTPTPEDTTSSDDPAADSTTSPDTGNTDEHPLPGSTPSSSTSADRDPIAALGATVLDRLQTISSTGTIWWTPYDDPDVSALAGAGHDGQALLTRELKRGIPDDLRKISDVTVAWPASAIGSRRTTQITSTWKKATQKTPTLVLPERSVMSLSGTTTDATRRVKGSSGVLVYDESLSSILSTSATSPLLAAQRFLARTAAIYQQRPGTPRSVAVVLPRADLTPPEQLAQAITRVMDAPWLVTTSGVAVEDDLPAHIDSKILRTPAPGPHAPPTSPSPVSRATFTSLADDRRTMRGLQSILVDSDDVVGQRLRSLDAAGSTRWRGHGADQATVVRVDAHAVEQMRRKVSVLPSAVNFFANSGQLSVTVVNGLNRPLKDVQLTLHPRKFLLRIRQPDKQLQIRAASRSTARFQVKAVAAGNVPIDVLLHAPDGLPLGSAPGDVTQLKVNVRPTSSWIYWALGIVAGLVLVVGLARSLRRGPRTVTAPGPTGAPIPDPAAEDRSEQERPEAGEDD